MVKGRVCVVLVMLLAVLACAVEARHRRRLRSHGNRRADFDFFFLVRQWPATFCNDHQCTHRPPQKYAFTLHGLWPQRRDGTWPEFCDPSSHLRMDDIDDLVDDMEHDWPSWSSADEVFWDHEWNRHGTCAAPVTGDQHRFFKTVLGLHHRFNIQAALSVAGIRPSNSRRYPVQDIKDAIEDMYGVMPHVTCDGRGELSEVWMCVNKKLRPIDCVEDPRPHNSRKAIKALAAAEAAAKASAGSITAQQQEHEEDALKAAPVPPNYNCNMVTIPKLRRGWSQHDKEDDSNADSSDAHHSHHHHHQHHSHHDHDEDDDGEDAEYDNVGIIVEAAVSKTEDAAGNLVATVTELGESIAAAVREGVEQMVADPAADSTAADADAEPAAGAFAHMAASLSAVEQAAAAVALSVAEAVVATAVSTEADAAPAAASLAQQQPGAADKIAGVADAVVVEPDAPRVPEVLQQRPVSAPNKHLPVLAAVVMVVVAAAVVAVAVAVRSHVEVPGSCSAQGYLPPKAAPEGPEVCESSPLLPVSTGV